MPNSVPISRSDQALASTAAGDILKSAGSTAVPVVAVPGADYLQPDGDGSQLTGITQSQVGGLTTALASKANDSGVVHRTGNLAESVTGPKTFTDPVRVGTVSPGSATTKIQSGSAGGYIGTESTHPLNLRTDNLDRITIGTGGEIWVNSTVAGSADAQFEARSKDSSKPSFALYDPLGTLGFLVDAKFNLQANKVQTFATSVTAPTTVADVVDFALFSMVAGTGSGTYDLTLNMNGSGFSQTKRYILTTTWAASTDWRTAVPFSSTGVYEGNDCELDFRQTTYQLEIRLRRVSGSTAAVGTLIAVSTGPVAVLAAGTGATSSVTPPTEKFLSGRTGGVPGNFEFGGWIRVGHMADADAPNDSDYFSTTQGKRAYKDAAGVVHTLY